MITDSVSVNCLASGIVLKSKSGCVYATLLHMVVDNCKLVITEIVASLGVKVALQLEDFTYLAFDV